MSGHSHPVEDCSRGATSRIVFPFIGQLHQMPHSLPIAAEMSARHPDVAVHVACATQAHLDYARALAALYRPSRLRFEMLDMPALLRGRIEHAGLGPMQKIAALALNRRYFARFDAIVVPERTSLYLKRMGVKGPKFVWTRHGAGDRAVGFADDVRLFDFVLIPGTKIEQRLLAQGVIREGRYHPGCYAKFDLVRRMRKERPRLFARSRPTVLYNPHFSNRLSSWPAFGERLLAYFAAQDRYNLIFAPHLRLFDGRRAEADALMRRFSGHPHLLIDPGSTRSIDMTYTLAADLYLGDVSSQVAEFVIRPRPCLFLNAHQADWRDRNDYEFWRLGEVLENLDGFSSALERAQALHPAFAAAQKGYVAETFGPCADRPTAPGAADAIYRFLQSDDDDAAFVAGREHAEADSAYSLVD